MSQNSRFDAVVKGRVQGVWFRNFTQNEASRLGLTGEVKNLADGTVRVIAEGDEVALQKLIQKLHEGPDLARVKEVVVNWENFLDQYSDFSVSY